MGPSRNAWVRGRRRKDPCIGRWRRFSPNSWIQQHRLRCSFARDAYGDRCSEIIGGGSAGTAGGIKITTFLVLAFAIWNEIRGREHVTVAHRSISSAAQRQALTVALLGVGAVISGTMLLLILTDYSLEKVLFESISAFATVGLSTGITFGLPPEAQWVLMFAGRIGTITVASALAISSRPRLYQLPEERPIIG